MYIYESIYLLLSAHGISEKPVKFPMYICLYHDTKKTSVRPSYNIEITQTTF